MAAHKEKQRVRLYLCELWVSCEALQYSVWQSDWRVGRAGGCSSICGIRALNVV